MQFAFVPVIADPVNFHVLAMSHAHGLASELSLVDAVDASSLRIPHKVQISVPVSRRLHGLQMMVLEY